MQNLEAFEVRVPATVKWFDALKKFGFFKVEQDGEKMDVLVHLVGLQENGYLPSDMQPGTTACIDVGRNPASRKLVVAKIHQIGPKTQCSRQVVDRQGEDVIVKVTPVLVRGDATYEVRLGGEKGSLWGTYYHLSQARESLGRELTHSVDWKTHGVKTNVPGQGPAKAGSAGGHKKGQSTKTA